MRDIHYALKYHDEGQEDYSVMVRYVPGYFHGEDGLGFNVREGLKKMMEEKVA